MTVQYSIYIPQMEIYVTEEFIKNYFDEIGYGYVFRVDFVPINKKPGFLKTLQTLSDPNIKLKSAFIHMNIYVENPSAVAFFINVENSETVTLYPMDTIISWTSWTWNILKTHNPIPETMMNIHQVVQNSAYLEKKIYEQEEMFQMLEEKYQAKIKSLENIVAKLANEVICLTGVDVLKEEENNIIIGSEQSFDLLHDKIETYQSTNSTSLYYLNNNLHLQQDTAYDSDKTDSTHSSMPSLVSIGSTTSTSSERIRNSYDLCGNN